MKLPFPEVILICPDNALKNWAEKLIKRKLNEDGLEISFYLSTWEEIKKTFKFLKETLKIIYSVFTQALKIKVTDTGVIRHSL